jgi:hypothetical protein
MSALLLYTRRRLLRPHVGAAVILVSAGALVVAAGARPSLPMILGPAALLVCAFRIADDVMERTSDSESLRVLTTAAGALWVTAATICWIARGAASLGLLMVFTALLALWYRTRGSRSSLGDHILLSKYAAFAAVVGGVRPALVPRGLLALTVVYLSACVYEWAHDTASPATVGERSVEAVLLAVASTALMFSIGGMR